MVTCVAVELSWQILVNFAFFVYICLIYFVPQSKNVLGVFFWGLCVWI